MRVFLTGQTNGGERPADVRAATEATGPRPVRLLLSYHYFRDADLDAILGEFTGASLDVFADSGAYSAWSVGARVEPAAYTDWVRRWQHWFGLVAGPDVIGDAAATAQETRTMREALPDVCVVPTFHVGEPWPVLEAYAKEYPYLALGGMVPYTRQRALLGAWLDKAFRLLPAGKKVHGFGLTTWELLLRYPWASVDSSSWTAGFRFGSLALFDRQRGRFVTISMKDRNSLLDNRLLLHEYGLSAPGASGRTYDRDKMVVACVRAWQAAEEYLTTKRVFLVARAPGTDPAGSDKRHAGGAPNAIAVMNHALKGAGDGK